MFNSKPNYQKDLEDLLATERGLDLRVTILRQKLTNRIKEDLIKELNYKVENLDIIIATLQEDIPGIPLIHSKNLKGFIRDSKITV